MSEGARDGWARGFAERARAHWTPERSIAAFGDKQLVLEPGRAAVLLRALGLLNGDGSMPPARARKFLQINHMVALLEPLFDELRARHSRIRVLDAACGRSYLSLLLAWCGREVWGHPIEVVGVDRNAALVEECRRRAELAGLEDVTRFEASALEAWQPREAHHALISLHACDTATCDALALAVRLEVELIASAPCCQAELARGWAALPAGHDFGAVHGSPHLRRQIAAHVTDAMRMLLLRREGYQTTAMEFVPAEHTQKNTLLRAARGADPGTASEEYAALKRATGGVGIALERLLAPR